MQPNNFDSLHLLGVIYHQRGAHAEAVRQIDVALKVNSKHALAHGNRGNALKELRRPHEALASLDRALVLKPDYAEAFNNRGVVLQELKRGEEALASYEKAIAIKPDYAEAFFNRGIVLKELKRPDEASASYEKAIALKPDFAEAFTNLGNMLKQLKRFEDALASYDRALALKPNIAEALSNRGVTLQELKRFNEALASYDRALTVKPDFAEALSNRGVTLQELKQLSEALASYDRALAVTPDYAEALNNRGDVLKTLKRYEEAIVDFERTLSIDPDFEYTKGSLLYSKMQCCDWGSYAYDVEGLRRDLKCGKRVCAPFALLCLCESASDQLLCCKIWARDKCTARPAQIDSNRRLSREKIRIAYISADYQQHATAYLMAELIERHDRSRFEIIGISFGLDDKSEMRKRLVATFDQFYDVREKSDEEVAKCLRDLQVDIAIDLKGYTQDSRPGILAHRPAPIQAGYLGFPGTMGTEFIDYIIADRMVAPFEHQPFYTEKIVHLPDCYQVNDTKRTIAERTPTRREAGLPETGFVFCCFNNNWKITPDVFSVWMRLLRLVDGSVLWLLRDNAAAEANLRKEATARGVDPSRLVFAGRLPLDEHLARHRVADLFLDTLPVNAHTTASDALWAGLPVITRLGEAFAGRVAASLLNAIGLPELVTHSIEEYETLALRLASDSKLLEGYRNRLATNRLTHPLFDTDRFRRHIEAAYLQMWEIWQRGEQPRSFAVETELTQLPTRQEPPNLSQMIKKAAALHQKGELAEAESLYLQILKVKPDHFDGLHLFGVLRHQQGRNIEALELIETALQSKPNVSQVLSSYGTVLDELKRYDEALAAYDRALKIRPDDAETHYCRAITLIKLKRHEEAVASYDKALAIKPQYVEALYNRGNALKDLDRCEEALASYDRALALRPNYAKALFNRGVTLQELKRYDQALASYNTATALKPDYAEAYVNRAVTLCELAKLTEAEASFRRALELKPDRPDVLMKLSDLLLLQGRVPEAIVLNRRAVELDPDNSSYHTALIFALNFDSAASAADHQAERSRWYGRHAKHLMPLLRPHSDEPDPGRRLRIGYVSGHFRHQAATYAFAGVLTNHDPKQYDVVCYSDTKVEDDFTAHLRDAVSNWRFTAKLSDEALAELIRADRIDILVDLVGHMSGNRLLVFARKPAPVQVTGFGEPTGTGLKTMDYLLADPVLVPEAERGLVAEMVSDLPNFLGYFVPQPLPEPGDLPAISRGYVTFGSFNRLAKMNESVLRTWARILREVPRSQIVIKESRTLGDASQRRISEAFAAEGVDPKRVALLGASDRAGHFKAYSRIDIALDTFPHGGGMTTLDALWMGVPVITQIGRTISSRLAASSLTALGMCEFIAADADAYIELAVAKARDLDSLVSLRKTLRRRIATSALGDGARYAQAVERAYREMWQRWCRERESVSTAAKI